MKQRHLWIWAPHKLAGFRPAPSLTMSAAQYIFIAETESLQKEEALPCPDITYNWESSMADAVRECWLLVSLLPPGHQVSPAQCWLNGHHCGGVGSSTPWPCLRRPMAWWLWEHQGWNGWPDMWAYAFYYSYFSSLSHLLALVSSSLTEIWQTCTCVIALTHTGGCAYSPLSLGDSLGKFAFMTACLHCWGRGEAGSRLCGIAWAGD